MTSGCRPKFTHIKWIPDARHRNTTRIRTEFRKENPVSGYQVSGSERQSDGRFYRAQRRSYAEPDFLWKLQQLVWSLCYGTSTVANLVVGIRVVLLMGRSSVYGPDHLTTLWSVLRNPGCRTLNSLTTLLTDLHLLGRGFRFLRSRMVSWDGISERN